MENSVEKMNDKKKVSSAAGEEGIMLIWQTQNNKTKTRLFFFI